MGLIRSNPIVRFEMRRRFSGFAAAAGIGIAIGIPGLAVVVAYALTVRGNDQFNGIDSFNNTGVILLTTVVVALTGTLVLFVPALAGGSIASERANQTLQPLQLTLLRPAQIVVGKLIASSAYLMVVIACALPVIAIPYLLGGVPVRTVITCLIVLAAIAIELAAVSVWVSSWFTKPVGAIVTALAMSLALCLGPWVVAGLTLVSQVTVAADGSPPPFDENAARLLAATSPTALFGFVDLGDIADDDPAGSSGRLVAAACWLGVTTLCIRGAAKRVVAPAERDR